MMVQAISVRAIVLCLSLNLVASSKKLAEENSLINDISKEIAEAAANAGVVLAGKWDKNENNDQDSVNKFLDEVVKGSSKKIEVYVKKLAVTRKDNAKVEDTPLFLVMMKLSGSHLKRLTLQRANSLTTGKKFVGTVNYSDEMKENNLLEAVSNSLSNEYEKELKNKIQNKTNKVESLASDKAEGKTFDTNLANLVAFEENTKGREGIMSDLATRSIERDAFVVAKKMSRQVIKKYTHTTTKTVTSSSGESRSISDSKSITMPAGSEIGSNLQGTFFGNDQGIRNLGDYQTMGNREIGEYGSGSTNDFGNYINSQIRAPVLSPYGKVGVSGEFGQRSQFANGYNSVYEKAHNSGFSRGSSSSSYIDNGNSQTGYPCVGLYCGGISDSRVGIINPRDAFDSNMNRGVVDFNRGYNIGTGREGGYYHGSSQQQSSSSKKLVSDSSSSQSSSRIGYNRSPDSRRINIYPEFEGDSKPLPYKSIYPNTYESGNLLGLGGKEIYSSSSSMSDMKSSADSKSSKSSSSRFYNYGTEGKNNIYTPDAAYLYGGQGSSAGSQYSKLARSSSKKAASSSSSDSSKSYESNSFNGLRPLY
uniref:Uncharacterized protein n=1 Tax=Cuerna arida TaxID=1464854 RepID=A0A1B6GFI5_9HEMI